MKCFLIPFSIQAQLGKDHKEKTTINQGSEQVYDKSYNYFSEHMHTSSMHPPSSPGIVPNECENRI